MLFSFFHVPPPPSRAPLPGARARTRRRLSRLRAAHGGRAGCHRLCRNLDDGRVEVYAAGPPDKLSDLAAALRKGPRFSDVRGVDEQEAAPQHYSDFQIEV